MNLEKLLNDFSAEEIELSIETSLEKRTTFSLEASSSVVEVFQLRALQRLVSALHQSGIAYRCLGQGSNFVLSPRWRGVLIKMKFPFEKKRDQIPPTLFSYPANTPLGVLTKFASQFGIKGWEIFTGIPAELGGAVAMNAGTSLGEMGELVESFEVVRPSGEVENRICTKESFSYRRNHLLKPGEIISAVTLRHFGTRPEVSRTIKSYLRKRQKTQPLWGKNCGCVYKNKNRFDKAGLLMDRLGLKGYGGAKLSISEKHANFFNNKQKASFYDFTELDEKIQHLLEFHYGLSLEKEVQVIG